MVSALTTVINCCSHWCDFSETRWTKVGLCGRICLRNLSIGVEKLAALAMDHDAVSRWHLGGFHKRCNSAARSYLVVAALAARSSEAMLFEFMQDDRFLLSSDRCWVVMQ